MENVLLQKANVSLTNKGVDNKIENETIYVFIDDVQLELSEFEIKFQATLFDEEVEERNNNKNI